MADNVLPPIPNDEIGEKHVWREWFFNLGRYIQVAQAGGVPWTVPQGGTGNGSITGYLKGNGVSPLAGVSSIPYSDISGAPVVGVLPISNKTGNYTLSTTDYTILAIASGGGFTVTLPLNPVHGQVYNIKKTDSTSNSVTISGNSKLIDGVASLVLTQQYLSIMVQYDSTSTTWSVI